MDTPNTSMPDITAMQKIVGGLTAVITVGLETLTAFGAGLTVDQDTKLLALWGALSAFALTADAIIRQGRAKHVAIVKAAEITAAAPAVLPQPIVVAVPSPPAKAAAKRTTRPKATT